MPDRTDKLDALIAKLEGASVPDRSLFEEAYEAAWGRPCWDDGERGERFQRFLDAEAWTDAALSLVPEGHAAQLCTAGLYGCDTPVARVYDRAKIKIDQWPLGMSQGASNALSLALCIAALKARRAAC